MINDIMSGAAGAILSNHVSKHTTELPHLFTHGECLHDDIHAIRDYLHAIAKSTLVQPRIDMVIQVPVAPLSYLLSTQGRRHNLIFVPNSTTSFLLTLAGIGQVSYTPSVGWTQLDLPEGSGISLASGSGTMSLLYRCMDESEV